MFTLVSDNEYVCLWAWKKNWGEDTFKKCCSHRPGQEVDGTEVMKLSSSRKAVLQPEARLSFPEKRLETRGLARPVFHTLGSAARMQTACQWQRKPRCIKSERLRPGEFTQRVVINPPLRFCFPILLQRCHSYATFLRSWSKAFGNSLIWKYSQTWHPIPLRFAKWH